MSCRKPMMGEGRGEKKKKTGKRMVVEEKGNEPMTGRIRQLQQK